MRIEVSNLEGSVVRLALRSYMKQLREGPIASDDVVQVGGAEPQPVANYASDTYLIARKVERGLEEAGVPE